MAWAKDQAVGRKTILGGGSDTTELVIDIRHDNRRERNILHDHEEEAINTTSYEFNLTRASSRRREASHYIVFYDAHLLGRGDMINTVDKYKFFQQA